MKIIKNEVLKVTERILRNTAKPPKGDPPICPGFLHQPKRPYKCDSK